MLQDKNIAFVGSGNMAEAIISGLVQPVGIVPPAQIFAADIVEQRLSDLQHRYGIRTATNNSDVVQNADILILAVKPQVMKSVIEELTASVDDAKLVISIAAGVKIDRIQQELPSARIIRVMPNVAALVHASMSAISPGPSAMPEDLRLAQDIFQAVGETVVVEEKLMDAVTGLSGSGPGYIFYAINALADGGVKVGLPRDIALKLAAQTVYGAAKMAIETREHPMQLRDKVTSPGGTTIAGLYALERHAFGAALMDAVETATRRAQELGN
jgi:pyrroline-5-carboxylate reductase